MPMQRCTLRLSILWHNSISSLFLSTYTTLYILLIGFLPVPVFTAEDFGITALLRDRLLARSLLRLLIIIRPDTPTFLTGERIGVLFGPFVPCFFLGSPDSLIPPLALCFQVLLHWPWSQPNKQRKLFQRKESPISCD